MFLVKQKPRVQMILKEEKEIKEIKEIKEKRQQKFCTYSLLTEKKKHTVVQKFLPGN